MSLDFQLRILNAANQFMARRKRGQRRHYIASANALQSPKYERFAPQAGIWRVFVLVGSSSIAAPARWKQKVFTR